MPRGWHKPSQLSPQGRQITSDPSDPSDPITDYYAMQAVFAGVQHGERTLRTPDYDERTAKAAQLRRLIEKLDDQLAHFTPLANPALNQTQAAPIPNPRENVETFAPVEARFVRFTVHETLNHAEPCLDELEVFTAGDPPQNAALSSAGAKATASGTLPNFEIHKLEHINDGKTGNDHSWISNEAGRGWVQIELPEKYLINKIVWSRDRREIYKDRMPTVYTIETATAPNLWQPVAGRPPLRPPVMNLATRPSRTRRPSTISTRRFFTSLDSTTNASASTTTASSDG